MIFNHGGGGAVRAPAVVPGTRVMPADSRGHYCRSAAVAEQVHTAWLPSMQRESCRGWLRWGEGDGVAEGFELADQVPGVALLVDVTVVPVRGRGPGPGLGVGEQVEDQQVSARSRVNNRSRRISGGSTKLGCCRPRSVGLASHTPPFLVGPGPARHAADRAGVDELHPQP